MTDKDDRAPKYCSGKAEFDKIPVYPLWETAKSYNQGGNSGKYPARSWEEGMPWGEIFSAMIRHALKWQAGEVIDLDDNIHHLAHVAWCAWTLMEYEQTHPEFDDRSKNHTFTEMIKKGYKLTWVKEEDLRTDESKKKKPKSKCRHEWQDSGKNSIVACRLCGEIRED